MLDTTQILLLILILLITTIITIVGVQFYLVLKEIRKGVENVNGILEEFKSTAMNFTSGSQHLKEATAEIKQLAVNVQEGLSTPLVSGVATFGLIQKLIKPFFAENEEGDNEDEL